MNADCERYQHAILSRAAWDDHLSRCDDCSSFYAIERQLAPPDDLVARTVDRLRPALLARASHRREIFWGLTLAGALSFPIIVALNTAMVWMTFATIEHLATRQLAIAGASLLGVSLLLALSVAYGSLPLLASWGIQLRERTI
ncbi:MAG: hypothetical protein BMS9Abin37_0778 [Acidobacteriota bacterium]|nr:MAG: hypothetical protein BMS9Abin37_0778 [Acidobacteriota bacterium]